MAHEEFDYHKILADMEAKRDAMNAAIEGMRLMLGIGAGSIPAQRQSATGELTIENGAFFGMSIPDASEKYMRMTPKILRSTKEISDALEAGGFETNSARFFNTVYNSLSRYEAPDGNFVKVGKKWGLAEWYPGHKPKPRKGTAEANATSDSEPSPLSLADEDETAIESTSTSVS